MASRILEEIQEEATCPICLDLLTEPLFLDCGHIFCQACITEKMKESGLDQEGKNCCPVCRVTYQPENVRPIRLLANIMEKFREVKLNSEKEQKIDLCVHHGEKLLLFCEEDEKVICWLCERSKEHYDHQTFLLEEIALEYQNRLQETLEKLWKKKEEADQLRINNRKQKTFWQNQIQTEIQSVQKGFKVLKNILDSKEQSEIQKLKEEKTVIFSCLDKADGELDQQSQLVQDLISDVEHRLQASSMEMLQDVNGVIKRSERLTLMKPQSFSKAGRRSFRVPDLKGILLMFDELRDMQCHWDDITLNVSSKKPNIAISQDQKEVRYVKSRDMKNQSLCYVSDVNGYEDYSVVGSAVIKSGEHYWEVDVSHKTKWLLGICRADCYHKENRQNYNQNGIKSISNRFSLYQPENGYWVIGLTGKDTYNVFGNYTGYSNILTVPISIPPRRVGIYVHYEAHTISFYNITNHGFLIYKFSSCVFSNNAVLPYFNPMDCQSPLTLCSPHD